MSLKIYRIDRSLSGKLNNFLKTPDLPLGRSNAVSPVGNPFKNFADYQRENSYVLSKESEIEKFTEAFGNDWVNDKYYIRHPKKIMTDILIPAERFHSYVVRQQIADIISYIRSNVRVKELNVSINKANKAKVGLEGVLEGMSLEGEASIGYKNDCSATISCPRPLKASEKKTTYTWINDFPHLIAIVDEADSGTFEIKEEFDLNFGIKAKAAEAIGASASWNSNHTFTFKVTAG